MKGVEKLIFNTIVSHNEVNLPEVGALVYDRISAKLRSKKELTAPINMAVYYPQPVDGAPSIIELICIEAQCDEAQALRIYKRWLYGARQDDKVLIDGVGEIRNHFFYPSAKLQATLNPLPMNIKLKPRRRFAVVLWTILAVMVVIGASAGGYFYHDIINLSLIKLQEPPQAEVVIVTPEPVAEVVVPAPEPEPEPEPDYAAMKYQVVAGVYKRDVNADRFIAREKLDTASCRKITLSNGNIIVSLYSTNDLTTAQEQRQHLSELFPRVWIYEQK